MMKYPLFTLVMGLSSTFFPLIAIAAQGETIDSSPLMTDKVELETQSLDSDIPPSNNTPGENAVPSMDHHGEKETLEPVTVDASMEEEEELVPITTMDMAQPDLVNVEKLGGKERFTAEQLRLIEADRLFSAGQIAAAAAIYRQIKPPFPLEADLPAQNQAIANYDETTLSPKAGVYWRIAQQGLTQNLETKTLIPLASLIEAAPDFIPGQVAYIKALRTYNKVAEADTILNRLAQTYPQEWSIVALKIEREQELKRWIEASLMARRFAIMNPDHPQMEEALAQAEENLVLYQKSLRAQLRGSAIANIITGVLGYAFTGGLLGPLSALQTTMLLLEGEAGLGAKVTEQALAQLPIVEDPEVVDYVSAIGQQLAAVAGRDEFEYQFFVVLDENVNAFALPGGKVFVNTGAIAATNSEAELAGLLAHEIAHAVLSHGFQLVTEGSLTANIAQYIPYVGNTAANLIVLNYSRDMEKEADIFGTRILAASPYADDGVRNMMAVLAEEYKDEPRPPVWFSTHPESSQRIKYLEEMILKENLDRYGYEGIERHRQIKEKVNLLWEQHLQEEGLLPEEESIQTINQ
ncbi:MAG: M48 family metalloprotease [Synechococcaceae cyanobacterium RL_1_2]|nr:M48 family metalloprotease [Synechococcaceae cyanobacterium RL_1_2]